MVVSRASHKDFSHTVNTRVSGVQVYTLVFVRVQGVGRSNPDRVV